MRMPVHNLGELTLLLSIGDGQHSGMAIEFVLMAMNPQEPQRTSEQAAGVISHFTQRKKRFGAILTGHETRIPESISADEKCKLITLHELDVPKGDETNDQLIRVAVSEGVSLRKHFQDISSSPVLHWAHGVLEAIYYALVDAWPISSDADSAARILVVGDSLLMSALAVLTGDEAARDQDLLPDDLVKTVLEDNAPRGTKIALDTLPRPGEAIIVDTACHKITHLRIKNR